MNNEQQTKNPSRKRLSDFLFILWAGGAALLSYSLVYALRKPYTAAAFEDVEFFDMDYKVVVTISQIVGYVISKFMGIKLITEDSCSYVPERPVVGLHVGGDLQFYRRTSDDGYPCQLVRCQYGDQFRDGQVGWVVCYE